MTDLLRELLADLEAEGDDLDAVVAGLGSAAWAGRTPAGWSIAEQIGHLTWTDRVARLAAEDPDGFVTMAQSLATSEEGLGAVDRIAAEEADRPVPELLAAWRTGRCSLASALLTLPAGTKLPWFGPPMSAASCATARLMETWAHGQDVRDTLGLPPSATSRLRHVAHIAVRTFGFAHVINDREVPTTRVRVELEAPGGGIWDWGPEDANERVTGPALDFCLLAVQRRHRDDLDVRAVGAVADGWLDLVQAFAGPPGPGRPPAAGA